MNHLLHCICSAPGEIICAPGLINLDTPAMLSQLMSQQLWYWAFGVYYQWLFLFLYIHFICQYYVQLQNWYIVMQLVKRGQHDMPKKKWHLLENFWTNVHVVYLHPACKVDADMEIFHIDFENTWEKKWSNCSHKNPLMNDVNHFIYLASRP